MAGQQEPEPEPGVRGATGARAGHWQGNRSQAFVGRQEPKSVIGRATEARNWWGDRNWNRALAGQQDLEPGVSGAEQQETETGIVGEG